MKNVRSFLYPLCLLAFVALLIAPGGALADDKPLLTIANSNWAPYKGQNLDNGGIATDITKQALTRAGYRYKEIFVSWKRAFRGAQIGSVDIIPAVWYTPERAISLNFTKPILTSRTILISRKDKPFEFTDYDALNGMIIGTSPGWTYPDAFEKNKSIKKSRAGDLETNLRRLIRGRIDLVIGEELAARFTSRHVFPQDEDKLHYSTKSLEDKFLHVVITKTREDSPKILADFNKALADMQQDGTYFKILLQYGLVDPH